jgi:hypothetical protein
MPSPMSDDLLRWIARCFARPLPPSADGTNLDMVDERLDTLERTQREINARLRLLERQADPRNLRDDG